MALDTRESSVITDHAFEPRTKPPFTPNPYLCGYIVDSLGRACNLAEAAHRETTIERKP